MIRVVARKPSPSRPGSLRSLNSAQITQGIYMMARNLVLCPISTSPSQWQENTKATAPKKLVHTSSLRWRKRKNMPNPPTNSRKIRQLITLSVSLVRFSKNGQRLGKEIM